MFDKICFHPVSELALVALVVLALVIVIVMGWVAVQRHGTREIIRQVHRKMNKLV